MLDYTKQELELCYALRDLGIAWEPSEGDWAITAVNREVSVVIGLAKDGMLITSRAPSVGYPRSQFLWFPHEHQARKLLFKTGLHFITVEGGKDNCKSYGWLKQDDWKSAEPENVWGKGQTPREALLAMLIKIYSGETEWQYD